MPTVREIEQALFGLAPKSGAMDWDNVGHLVGDPDREVDKVLVALDITQTVADEAAAAGCQLIVSHHPVMNCTWRPVQSVRTDDGQGRLLTTLVKNDISAICMHTNLDVAPGGVGDAFAAALGLEDPGPLPGDDSGLCRVGTLKGEMPLQEFARKVCGDLHANGVRYAGSRPVRRVAVGGGACGEYAWTALAAGCDTFVTADLKYHEFLDVTAAGLNLIDAGHFPTEDPVCARVIAYLTEKFPELSVSKSTSHQEVIQYIKGE